jgi:DNA invertase Pin-like site-specific DNA recombinase
VPRPSRHLAIEPQSKSGLMAIGMPALGPSRFGPHSCETAVGAYCARLTTRTQERRAYQLAAVLVAAFDRVARSVRHFLEVLDELNHLGIEFVSFQENIDTGGPLGRAMVVIVGAIAELERSLIVERVCAGMRRAKLEGRRIGRAPLDIDREQVVRDRRSGMSLRQVARKHGISRASVCRLVKESGHTAQILGATRLAA